MKYSIFVLTIVAMVGSSAARAEAHHHCRCRPEIIENDPIVIDSCIAITPEDIASALKMTTCVSAGDYPRWTCQLEGFYYEENDTLYFPASNNAVIQKTSEWAGGPFTGVESTKEAAFRQLRWSFENQLESQMGVRQCDR